MTDNKIHILKKIQNQSAIVVNGKTFPKFPLYLIGFLIFYIPDKG